MNYSALHETSASPSTAPASTPNHPPLMSTATAIDALQVKTLREKTGAGLMKCKEALAQTNGDIESAIDFLRKKGAASAAKKAGREAREGIIAQAILPGAKVGVIVEINCETGFQNREERQLQCLLR